MNDTIGAISEQAKRLLVDAVIVSVTYMVLDTDESGYIIDDPNASGGMQALDLELSRGTVRLTWVPTGPEFRDSAPYMLSLTCEPQFQDIGTLASLDATDAEPWRSVVGHPVCVTVVCGAGVPSGIRIRRDNSDMGIVLGYYPATFSGDGDELLIVPGATFGDPYWTELSLSG